MKSLDSPYKGAILAFCSLAVLFAAFGMVYSFCRKTDAPSDKPGAARELVQSPAKTPARPAYSPLARGRGLERDHAYRTAQHARRPSCGGVH
jgi:hypothetical protein